MLRALDKNNFGYLAWDAEKKNKPYFCPNCHKEVILRQGEIKAHHFAHKPPIDCIYGTGESEIHYRIKKQLYEYLKSQSNCEKCDIERNLETVRPDISLYINKIAIEIEIQKSTIDTRIIKRRMIEYYKKKIAVLWIIPDKSPTLQYHENEETFVHRALEWEIYLHALNYGKLYYWQGDNILKAYHFNSFQIYRESSEWYDEYGDEQSAGGYYYYAKRLKLCNTDDKNLYIEKDFIRNFHKKYSNSTIEIPECFIYRDNYTNWWK